MFTSETGQQALSLLQQLPGKVNLSFGHDDDADGDADGNAGGLSLHYWLRPIKRGQFRFADFAPYLKGKCHFHFLIL